MGQVRDLGRGWGRQDNSSKLAVGQLPKRVQDARARSAVIGDRRDGGPHNLMGHVDKGAGYVFKGVSHNTGR